MSGSWCRPRPTTTLASLTTLGVADIAGTLPASQIVPPGQEWVLQSVSARYNGAAASNTFYPVLSVYSQDGKLVGRYRPTQQLAFGDTAEVTFGPF